MNTPLAERLRPKKLEEYIGQEHLIGTKGILQGHIKNGIIPSLIFWGPPGIGKTTLALLLAEETKRPFYSLSAINSGVKDIREVLDKVRNSGGLFTSKNPILFIDEIHRFSKSQQDSLLGAVEKGIITLVGATTENPSFEVIPALLSRCQIYTLKAFSIDTQKKIVERAIREDVQLKNKNITIKEIDALIGVSGGDARKLLNTLEIVINAQQEPIKITNEIVLAQIQNKTLKYDKSGENHYDIISAFIKSIRGSDPNGAVYWLARMIEGGEDVKFIARRMLIAASEDIGNANPNALLLAQSTFQSVSVIGYPESRLILSQCAIYLACSEKSNASYMAINNAQTIVRETGNLEVPLSLRNAPTKLMKDLDYGKEYKYSHNYDNNFVNQEFLPKEISGKRIYEPGNNSKERNTRKHLHFLWKSKYGY